MTSTSFLSSFREVTFHLYSEYQNDKEKLKYILKRLVIT